MHTWNVSLRTRLRPVTVARRRWALGAAALAALAAACAVLYACPPARSRFYPPCPFHALTGLHCPGCGTARAGHALLHGDLAAALGLNPLAVLSLPFLAYALASRGAAALFGRALPRVHLRAGWSWALLGLVLAYWLLRNLPAWPFTCLAP